MEIEKTIKIAVENNLPCLLVGKHGTGKSYAIMQAAKQKKTVLHRVIITQETTPEDLVCQYELKDNETIMIKHSLLEAAEKGEWICFEEINMGSPAVLTLLNGLLETDPGSRYIRFQDLEIKPHKKFRMFATSNPTAYSGANRMNDALLSRFLVQMVEPDYHRFLKIIEKEFGADVYSESSKFLSAILKIQKNYDIYISPRELLVYGTLRFNKVDHNDAVGLILGRHYDLDKEVIDDMAALFKTEMGRAQIFVLNDVEYKKKVDDEVAKKTQAINDEMVKLRTELSTVYDFKTKLDSVVAAKPW